MTISESYREYRGGKINKAQFMERARKDRQLKNLVTNVMSFDDTVRVLKNKGIISEALNPLKEAYEIMPAELRKGVNFELGLTYQAIPDWDSSFVDKAQLDKATNKALKNLEKDPLFYTKLIATGEKPKKEESTSDIEFKESNVSDSTNKTKADGYLKKELKKDEDANVQASLSKSEAKKGKPEGVEQLKENYMGTPYGSSEDMAVDMVKKGITEYEFSYVRGNDGACYKVTDEGYRTKVADHYCGRGSREVTRENMTPDGSAVGELMSRVADDWGQDSDLYSDLTDALAGWSDRHGNLSPKGVLAVKNLLSNWDVLEDYGWILDGPKPAEDIAADPEIPFSGMTEAKRNIVKEIIRKHVEEALKYTIGSDGEEHEYRRNADAELEKRLKDAGITFTKKNIS